ncbi:hypothetical protein E1A91_D06G115400v1 [Gossypium mustelinum]|uniref:Uncharacterized protein n=1 Tax=Gossypium mustelinum TaxID=34275 RepID=A0A5D2UJJ6_GOSMU|nr:hypothetical protein E1A91_D06G115400v1 [Gossypium mustelinum]
MYDEDIFLSRKWMPEPQEAGTIHKNGFMLVVRFVRSFQQHPKNRSSAQTMLVKSLLYS